jgi:hypothetical protein
MGGGPFSRRGAGATALQLAALAFALAAASRPGRALADDGEAGGAASVSASRWGTRAVTFSFFDSFLGMPHSALRDDNGFVASMHLAVELPPSDRERLRLGVSEQLLTERGGLRRVDDGRAYAGWQRYLGASPTRGLTIGWTAGVRVVGNLGGSGMQDWAHRTLFNGRLLDGRGTNRLQGQYPRGYDVLGDFGGLARVVHPVGGGPWSIRAGVEAGLGLGTGWFAELHPFVAVAYDAGRVEIELRQGAGIYGTNVRPLTMPGGYVRGILESQPSLHASVIGPPSFPAILSFDLEWNQGDSHQHVGGITVGARF